MIYFFLGIPLLQMILLPCWVLSPQDVVANRSPWAFAVYIPHLTGSQVLCMLNTSSVISLSMRFLSQYLLLVRQFLVATVKAAQDFSKIHGRSCKLWLFTAVCSNRLIFWENISSSTPYLCHYLWLLSFMKFLINFRLSCYFLIRLSNYVTEVCEH